MFFIIINGVNSKLIPDIEYISKNIAIVQIQTVIDYLHISCNLMIMLVMSLFSVHDIDSDLFS